MTPEEIATELDAQLKPLVFGPMLPETFAEIKSSVYYYIKGLMAKEEIPYRDRFHIKAKKMECDPNGISVHFYVIDTHGTKHEVGGNAFFSRDYFANPDGLIPKPKFRHDCDKCIFLGSFDGHDLYFSKFPVATALARFGNGGSMYKSGIAFAGIDPHITEALRRWDDQGDD